MSTSPLARLAGLPPGLVWPADRLARPAEAGVPTGFAALDAQLPGGGWPRGALIELLIDAFGIGELALLLPALRAAAAERWIAWIAPPHLPYAPALTAAGVRLDRLLLLTPSDPATTLWTIRQAVASGGCSVVVAWLPNAQSAALRRLQLAAEASATSLFVFRPGSAAHRGRRAAARPDHDPCRRADAAGGTLVRAGAPGARSSARRRTGRTRSARACSACSDRSAATTKSCTCSHNAWWITRHCSGRSMRAAGIFNKSQPKTDKKSLDQDQAPEKRNNRAADHPLQPVAKRLILISPLQACVRRKFSKNRNYQRTKRDNLKNGA
ncbi:translesion DNA synthesis-associated protein ImuA [Aromatoleum anaerobium]|nr:translesion DNA synthesis-associated protein ImuA [Aromatoleum anaerobium]MCK0507608.1 translesion DNA synthesis-associated protein ImuA [Aromatoleum anaerobium]